MDRAEAIKFARYAQRMARENSVREFYELAEAALREQEQREQGCEFCNADYAVMSASYMTFDFMHKSITPKFCALCGRKLPEPPKEGAEG